MRFFMTGASAAAIAMAMTGPAAAQQGQDADQQQGGERGAAEISCKDLSMMDTARIPGALYFIAGHQAGAGEAAPAEGEDQQGAGGMTGEEEGAEAQTVRLRGFFEIPIEDTILACAEVPDTPVAEVIAQQSAPAGDTPDGSTTGLGGETASTGDGAGGAMSGEDDPATGADTGSGDSGNGDTDAGGVGNVGATPDAGSTRGGEIVSPEEAAGNDGEGAGQEGTSDD